MERCTQEIYDRGGAEREQHNKQGIMEDDRQLYRRSQMTGQAMDEEEEDVGPQAYLQVLCNECWYLD